jgi:leucyl aminopeptidase
MEVSVSGPDSLAVEAQVLALAVRDETAPPGDLGKRVRSLLDEDGFEATAGDAVLLHLPAEEGVERVAVGGLGSEIDADAVRTAAGGIARLVEPIGGTVAWMLDDSLPLSAAEQARAVVDGLILGGYDPGLRKTEGRKDGVHKLVFVGGDDAVLAEAERSVVVARWANRARDLANEPPNDLTPAGLAEHAERIAAESDGRLQSESFGRERMTELGMGSFLAVSQGSAQEPRTIVLRYDPPEADGDATLGLVGKAVTFDTGGISIKPALYMEDMKGDMSGGAAVLAGLGAVAELGLPVRAIGRASREPLTSSTSRR